MKFKLTKSLTITLTSSIVTLIAVSIMLRLGFWQLQRMEEKEVRLQSIANKKITGPLDLESIEEFLDIQDVPVTFKGALLRNNVFLWDNRVVQGKVGYEVIVPVETNIGTVLTNWGWIRGTGYRDKLPDVVFPEKVFTSKLSPDNLHQFSGKIWQPSDNVFIVDTPQQTGQWPLVVQEVNVSQISEILGESLLPFVVALELPSDSGFVSNHKPVVMPPEKHLGYAIQWFGLAIGCFLVFIFASIKKVKNDRAK